MDKGRSLKKPKRLFPGGTVGVVAPAGQVDPNDLQRGVARLERLGLKVILGKHLAKRHRYFAGNDFERAEDLQEMFSNKEVAGILCARGGSGTARILPYLKPTLLAPFQKALVGCSDITTLLLYLTRSFGWVTFHGPMVATQFGKEPSPILEENFTRILAGERLQMKFPGVRELRPGRAQGVLTGGCLTLICGSIGTPYEIETDDKILFFEDIDEAPYRIDRMLFYLKSLGKFNRVKGVIFGQMPRCQPDLLPEIILDILGEFDFPILFGFPSGHGDATATLPFGILIRVDTPSQTVSLLEEAVL